jgi:hypothetical protein
VTRRLGAEERLPRAPLTCSNCEGEATVVVEVRPDPDNPLAPTVFRRRWCRDCQRVSYSAEVEIAEADALAAFARLADERQRVAGWPRPSRRPATMAGT